MYQDKIYSGGFETATKVSFNLIWLKNKHIPATRGINFIKISSLDDNYNGFTLIFACGVKKIKLHNR